MKLRFISATLSVFLVSACGVVSKTVKVVDESGEPLSGASMLYGATFFADSSGKNGRLRVSSNFPLIVKEGFYPVLVHLGDKKYTEATMLELPESLSEEDYRKIKDRLADESLKLSGEYTLSRLRR